MCGTFRNLGVKDKKYSRVCKRFAELVNILRNFRVEIGNILETERLG